MQPKLKHLRDNRCRIHTSMGRRLNLDWGLAHDCCSMFVHYSDCTWVNSTILPSGIRMSSDNLSCKRMTPFSTREGATGRSVVSGTKIPSLYCQPQSVGHKYFPIHKIVALQDMHGMNGTFRLRQLAAMIQVWKLMTEMIGWLVKCAGCNEVCPAMSLWRLHTILARIFLQHLQVLHTQGC